MRRGAKSNKEKRLVIESEKRKAQGEISSTQKTKSSKLVPPVRPFPKVYTRTQRRKLAAKENSKAQVFPEIMEAHEQQQEN